MTLPRFLTTVNPFSKYLAVLVCITLPFIGFLLGVRYQEIFNLSEKLQEESDLLIEQAPSPPSLTMPTLDPSVTENWKTYTKEGLWEIKYPINWHIIDENPNYIGLSDGKDVPRGPGVGYIYVQIALGYNANKFYDNILAKQVGSVEKSPILTITTLEQLKVDGYPAVRLLEETPPGAATEYSYQVSVYVKGPLNVRISAMSLRFRDKPFRPDEKFIGIYLPVFDQILSTLQFTD
mgnify:CR=1 FL=1